MAPGGGPGGWLGGWLGWGNVADVRKTKAASGQRFQDIKGALSNPAVARKVWKGNIVGILVLICIVVVVCLFFFVLM